MIVISPSWYVKIPTDEYIIGYVGENLIQQKVFYLEGLEYQDWCFKLDYDNKVKADVIELSKSVTDSGILLTFDIANEYLYQAGIVTAQIRATHSDGRARNTNSFNFRVIQSVNAPGYYPSPLPTEFYQMELNLQTLKNDAEAAALRAEEAAGLAGESALLKEYPTHLLFPNTGNPGVLYIDSSENKTYRWDSTAQKYYVVGSDYEQIKIICGGNANG